MNNFYRYILDKSSKKIDCPRCGKKRFVRYIDTTTGQYLSPEYGRCDREEKCQYHNNPKESVKCSYVLFSEIKDYSAKSYQMKIGDNYYFIPKSQTYELNNKGCYIPDYILKEKSIPFQIQSILNKKNIETMKPTPQPKKQSSFINRELITQSMKQYESNKFVQFLENHFNIEEVYKTLKRYYVGTSNYWQGATVFPQIDANNRVRTAKVMLYNEETGKRIKEPYNHINWLHTILNKENYNLEQCLFGEHLIPESNIVCIVESEKTAIIAAIARRQYCWVATGGKNGAKINPNLLTDKKVILFPDLGVDWSQKAQYIPGATVSNLLEKRATPEDRNAGLDLADFILREKTENKKDEPKPEPRPEPQPENPGEEIFERMAEKNPALKKLRDTFDLEVEEFSEYTELNTKELAEIAVQTIGYCNHIDKSQIPYFEEMLKHGIITRAEPLKDKYYVTGSTPF